MNDAGSVLIAATASAISRAKRNAKGAGAFVRRNLKAASARSFILVGRYSIASMSFTASKSGSLGEVPAASKRLQVRLLEPDRNFVKTPRTGFGLKPISD